MIFLAALLREAEEIAIMDSNITFSGFSITVMFSRVSQSKQKEMWTWTMEDIPPCSLPSLLLPSHPAWYIAHVFGLREPGEGRAALDNSRQTRHPRLPLCQRGSKPYLFSIFLFKLLGHAVLKPYLFCVFKQGLIDWDETESALTGVGASSLEQGRKRSPHNTVIWIIYHLFGHHCFLSCSAMKRKLETLQRLTTIFKREFGCQYRGHIMIKQTLRSLGYLGCLFPFHFQWRSSLTSPHLSAL